MSPFEIIMLLCFGAAWPVSIQKSWRSKSTGGKSIGFLFVILTGYVAGIIHKLFYNYDPVIFLYALNFCLVTVDAMLYFRNRRIEKTCTQLVQE
jgi:cyanate permease